MSFYQKTVFLPILLLALIFASCASNRLAMGYRFYMQGKYKEANRSLLVHLTRNLEKNEKALTYFYLGLVNADWGNSDKAIGYYTDAINLEPTYFQAYFNRGLEYMLSHNFTKALRDVQQANRIINTVPQNQSLTRLYDPQKLAFDKKIILIYLAMLNIKNKDFSQAETILDTLLKQETEDKELCFFIASIYLAESPIKNSIKALQFCKKGLEGTHSHANSSNLLIYSKALAANNKFSEAIEILDKTPQKSTTAEFLKKEYLHQNFSTESLEVFFDRWLKQQKKRVYPK